MKRILVLMFFLSACVAAPIATSNAVQIPDPLKLAIGALILAAVMAGLQAILDTFGLDLRGVGAAIAATVTAFVLLHLQGVIDIAPVQYDGLITIIFNVLVVIVGGVGVLRIITNPTRTAALIAKK